MGEKKTFNKNRFWDKVAIALVSGALLFTISYHLIKDYSVTYNKKTTVGKIVDFKHSSMTYYTLTYEYVVANRTYKGTVGVEYFECLKSRSCIGQEVLVHYSSKNPKYSQVNLKKYERHKRTIYLIQ